MCEGVCWNGAGREGGDKGGREGGRERSERGREEGVCVSTLSLPPIYSLIINP